MLQAGVIVSDYATLMVEIPKDNARPEAGEVYAAMDMPWTGRPVMRFSGRFSPAMPGGGISKLEITFAFLRNHWRG